MLRLALAFLLFAAPASALEPQPRRTVELPVLLRYVPPGDTIAADDIGTRTIPVMRLVQAVAAEAEDLLGKTPRRAVRPGQPVRLADIREPLVIRKGELVTIIVETGTMRLTAQGRANDDGAQGQAIRVANTRSGKTLDAVVAGPGTVKIESVL
jgi:flagella basal body P-ring formation protein FlgA